jgi:hypothetical protein
MGLPVLIECAPADHARRPGLRSDLASKLGLTLRLVIHSGLR